MTILELDSETIDPICGMTVCVATALHADADRDGKTFYFCSGHCLAKVLSMADSAKPGGL